MRANEQMDRKIWNGPEFWGKLAAMKWWRSTVANPQAEPPRRESKTSLV